jgi:methyl-accepting chemotaxis protein
MNWFDNLKISSKLIYCIALASFLGAITGCIGLGKITEGAKDSERMYTEGIVALSYLTGLDSNYQRSRVSLRDYLFSETPDDRQEYKTRMAEQNRAILESLGRYGATIHDAEERARFEQCKENLELYRQNREKIISLADVGQKTEALTLMKGDALLASRAAQSALQELITGKLKDGEKNNQRNLARSGWGQRLMVAILVLAFALRSLWGSGWRVE